jgi:corrinoid protein of di/trimethylamine methyltransferase
MERYEQEGEGLMADWTKVLKEAVVKGDEDVAEDAARRGLEDGVTPLDLLEQGAVAGIYEAGQLWQDGEYFLPDVILAAEAFNLAMKVIEPLLTGSAGQKKGLVVLGSVAGDAHDLGKNIVIALLRAARYDVVDLGTDVPADKFVEAVRERGPAALGLGAYMTTTMRNMADVIGALDTAGLRDRVKVIIGGAAVTDAYATQIGADGYADNAVEAVKLVDELVGAK